MKNTVSIYFLFLTSLLFAQEKRDNIWMLSHEYNPAYPKAGIDFTNGTADTFSLFRHMPFFINSSSICDTNGQLLFYTNGIYVANANHDTLQNGSNFNPGWETTDGAVDGSSTPQGSLIIPKPGSNSNYLIFHVSGEQFTSHGLLQVQPLHLSYSEVDMQLDNGLGGIIASKKDVHIINDTLVHGRITACKHANGRDWWIVVGRFYSNTYYKILVTPDTIYAPFSIQTIGDSIKYDALGQACFSPDGTKYANIGHESIINLMDFDRCSGDFSNVEVINLNLGAYGIFSGSFSPNSRYLYANDYEKIFQFDTYTSVVSNSKILVATWDTFQAPFATNFFAQQLAPDNRIYISTYGGCYVLHYIENPDSAGIACHVVQDSLWLPRANIGLPNFPNYDLGTDSGSVCDTLMLSIKKDIFKNENTTISVFPNPAQNYFYINYQTPIARMTDFILYNSFGEEILRKPLNGSFKNIFVGTNDLKKGIYFWKSLDHSGKLIIVKQ